VIAPSAGLAAATAAAAFAALARALGLWTGDFSRGAALAALCAAAGLALARLGGEPGERRAGAWRVCAGVAGAAFAAWTRLYGLNTADPALLDPAASVPALALLPAAALLFFLLGRAALGARPARALELLAAPAALAAARFALERPGCSPRRRAPRWRAWPRRARWAGTRAPRCATSGRCAWTGCTRARAGCGSRPAARGWARCASRTGAWRCCARGASTSRTRSARAPSCWRRWASARTGRPAARCS
jgi:hypothetical protein